MQEKKLEFLRIKLENQYGKEITKKIFEGYKIKRKTTFRVNTLKSNCKEIEKILNSKKLKFLKVDFIENAYILENGNKKDLESLEIYENGKIYVQSLSSMLPPIILNPIENNDILDMTAAPGGKTTQIAAMVQDKANITACEINKIRAEKLKYNIEKQGVSSVYVMIRDARKIDDFFKFDQILLDAPCSGSGTLDFNENNLENYFTKQLIKNSSKIQLELLKKAVNIVKSGDEIVYSTCSILEEENEKIVNEVLKNKRLKIVPIKFDNKYKFPLLPSKIDGTICIMPNEFFEGFFVAKIKKL
ncbi:MAG: RsmB/NOP family class I SAM-dependent RNA methyltransferase [Clostridia bacterium]|nr:RsmB/NOP family class I SAM-dependent RNA methyltransferase [Clostridia bacterium]